MICEKCNSELHYGDKYCNICGEEVDKSIYESEYKKSLWGLIDKGFDWYDTIFLKKITDSWIVKIIVLIAIIAWGFFEGYTDYAGMKILESDNYKIEYNKILDEYYVRTEMDVVNINLYIPKNTEKITLKEFKSDEAISEKVMNYEEYISKPLTVEKNTLEYLTVDSYKNDKVNDNIKIYVMD